MDSKGKDIVIKGDTFSEDDANASAVLRNIARQARKENKRDSREQDQPVVDRGCTFQQFTQANLSVFAGGPNPIVVEDWVQEIEKLLRVLECTKEQNVKYATYKLVGEVKRWWRLAKLVEQQRPGPMAITWSWFKEVFFDRYFPVVTRTIKQYAAKFVELSHFAPHMVSNESLKAQIFERGLRQSIRVQVVALLT
ncbi:uncharacterized protein LOC131160757 [Malania oleifera]|uniref:uncharacterized protein LOC131160757 n=1 Tax=Malania oleifera TaxID=397392 RepID=UPI0025AE5832|nr:uncharacterized protein LOC131160757 [Malania oleifera]